MPKRKRSGTTGHFGPMPKNYLLQLPGADKVVEAMEKEKLTDRLLFWKEKVCPMMNLEVASPMKAYFYNLWEEYERRQITEELKSNPPDEESVNRQIQMTRALAVELLLMELKRIQANSERLDGKNVDKLTRLYQTIRSETEAAERNSISRGKLKLEAVKTLLPYQRLSVEEITKLKDSLNDSFTRILQLKAGNDETESIGPSPVIGR